MIPWLDFKIFGSGFGMGQPFFDGSLHWLVDTADGERTHRSRGDFYLAHPGYFGAQLTSFQWRVPKPGERRKLLGMDFVVFQVGRGRWPIRWRVSWALWTNNSETRAELARRLEGL